VSSPTQTLRPVYAPIHPTSSPGASEVWRLDAAFAPTPALAFTLPAGTVVTAMLENAGSLFLGTSTGQVYRWLGSGSPYVVLSTDAGAVRGIKPMLLTNLFPDSRAIVAFVESASGITTWYTMGNDELAPDAWEPHTFEGLTGTRCSNVVGSGEVSEFSFDNFIATGTEAGDRVDVWHLFITYAELLYSFTERGNQRPGVLLTVYTEEEETLPLIFVGRHSLSATPLLDLWIYDRNAAVGQEWRRSINFATMTDGLGVADTNTSITAMAQITLRGKLYAATGTPYAGPQTGARVYVARAPD
jgi:hypothetical protein